MVKIVRNTIRVECLLKAIGRKQFFYDAFSVHSQKIKDIESRRPCVWLGLVQAERDKSLGAP